MKKINKYNKRLTKLEWKAISFALSTIEANGCDDLDCFGKDRPKMENALMSAAMKIANK